MPVDSNPKPKEVGSRLGHRVTIGEWKGHPNYKIRADYVEEGRYKRKGFKTKKAAEEWSEKRERENRDYGTADTLTAGERSTVVDTRERLNALGLDLRAAIEFAADSHERLSALGITPRAAIEFAADWTEKAQKSATVSELVSEVIDARRKANRSNRYLDDLQMRLGRFEKTFGTRSVATIQRNEIADWLHALKLTPSSINSYRRHLVVMFNDAIESGYIEEGHNPAAKVKKVKAIETEVGILTPEETVTLLSKAEDRILPAIAIGAFAGVRDAEIKRIEWSDVNFQQGHIRIRAVAAKSSRNRLIPISDNLKSWLQPIAQGTGKIWPANGRKLHEASRRAAGFGEPGTETDKEKEKGVELRPWPENALRHSFASYHLAHHQNAHQLALQMGHKGPDLIFAHYRELVMPKDAAAYWAVKPEDEAKNIINIKAS